MDPLRLAAFPFLSEAAELVDAEGPPVEALLSGLAWRGARAQGRARVEAALDGEPVPAPEGTGDHDALVSVLGYVAARLLVSVVDDKQLTNRYATAEARRVGIELEHATPDELRAVASELGVPLEVANGRYGVPFPAYLEAARDIKALEWKLVNQRLEKGTVKLEPDRAVRLVQEALKHRILAELPLHVPLEMARELETWGQTFRSRLAEQRARSVEIGLEGVEPEVFPPCIKALIAAIKASENVSHEGRFAVVAFLNTIGMDRDAIVDDLFSNVPDFAREVTEYQVDHITGEKGHEAYTPPGCSSLQTYGLCPMIGKQPKEWDTWCAKENMSHPLTYYRWGLFRLKKRRERPGTPTPAPKDT